MRPLKSLSALPQMRQLAGTLLAAVLALKEILLLLVLLWIVFAVLLVDLLHSRLNKRCRTLTEDGLLQFLSSSGDFVIGDVDGDGLADDGKNLTALALNYSATHGGARMQLDISGAWATTDLQRPCGLSAGAQHHCFHDDANRTRADELCLSVDDLRLIEPALPAAAEFS
jgi:hypothetical protein